ncbi:MAG: hypothetical protein ACRDP6_40150 [Actinoallomurus sp.]
MGARLALTAAAGLLLAAALPTAAQAASTAKADAGGGWQTIQESNREFAAGTVCSFALSNVVLQQDEQFRIARTYPDGSTLETDYRGPLVVQYTNEATGASAVRDLSGTAQNYVLPDKTSVWVSQQHFGLTVHPGDPYHAAGLYVLTGPSVFAITATGPDILAQSQVENICDTLG